MTLIKLGALALARLTNAATAAVSGSANIDLTSFSYSIADADLNDGITPTLAVPLAILVPLASWYVLQKLLLIQLPSGMFGIG